MRRLTVCLFVAAGLMGAAPATAAPAKPDKASVAAAEKLLDAIHYDQLLNRTIDALVAEQQKTFPQRLEEEVGQPIPDDLKAQIFDVIAKSMRGAITSSRPELRRGLALIYASRFTEAEMEHLIQVQTDPVMVKLQSQLPGIMVEASALGEAAVQREMPHMTKEIERVVKEYAAKDGKPAT